MDGQRTILSRAFDDGVTPFDLANNYGPPYGAAELNLAKLFAQDFRPYRDELVISTNAGYDTWPGPYGEWGSREYLLASLDQSLTRMGLDYVAIFYSHRFAAAPVRRVPSRGAGPLGAAARSARAVPSGRAVRRNQGAASAILSDGGCTL